ncbi:hypothetical protein [Bifidobacterium psychraerophilum]|uniref:hypothetical protein n=1 Tax=Bifidobacterium psychraerophilum TaxID=218140 RepID=UPI0039EB130C
MATVKSVIHPDLTVFKPKIQFHDGTAEVSNQKDLNALKSLEKIGIVVPETRPRTRKKEADG